MVSMPSLYKRSCLIVNKQSGLNAYKFVCRLNAMNMADRLKWRRKQLKLTQTQLAEKAGMTQQMIQQLETRKVLTTGKLVTLAGALGVRPQWLESGAEPMLPNSDLTPDERLLVEGYRTSSPAEKAALITLAVRGQPLPPTGKLQIQGQNPVG